MGITRKIEIPEEYWHDTEVLYSTEIAWPKDNILRVLKWMEETDNLQPILGGDVYQIVDGKPVVLPDGWFCNPIEGETEEEYAKRSINVTRKYIEAYPLHDTGNAVYKYVVVYKYLGGQCKYEYGR